MISKDISYVFVAQILKTFQFYFNGKQYGIYIHNKIRIFPTKVI